LLEARPCDRRRVPPQSTRGRWSHHESPCAIEARSCQRAGAAVWCGPYRDGRFCQGAPVRRIHNTPLSMCRGSAPTSATPVWPLPLFFVPFHKRLDVFSLGIGEISDALQSLHLFAP